MSWKNGKASLQRIVWKAKPYEALDATLEKNFILKHEEIVEPDYVLKVVISLWCKIYDLEDLGKH